MFKRKYIIFSYAPCGRIGNIEVYKSGDGYYLVDEANYSKFKFIR